MNDWNGNGAHDGIDDFIDYQLYQESRSSEKEPSFAWLGWLLLGLVVLFVILSV